MMRARRLIRVRPTKKEKKQKEKPSQKGKKMRPGGTSAITLIENNAPNRQTSAVLAPRKSVDDHLPVLNYEEREFFALVKSGMVEKVNEFLQSRKNFNINCQNFQGYTALVYAVKAENFAMVQNLLQYENLILGDSILHAVNSGDRNLVELLLDSKTFSGQPKFMEESKGYSADFPADTTPLILAAQMEHYDIIRLLIKRGHTIEKVHKPDCFCAEKCRFRKYGESLDESLGRINMYKALASPAYICQTSVDPILTSFQLAKELRDISELEREFKDVYLEMANQCSQLAVGLLDQCRTTEEIEMVLHRKEGNPRTESHDNWRFTRVGLAVELEEKEFVAHNNSQQVMRTAWLEGWQDWKTLNHFTRCCRVFPRIFLLPLMALIYLVMPRSKAVRSWRAPFTKYLCFLSSYILFLGLILAQNQLDSFNEERGPPNTGFEPFITLYVVGLTWRTVKIVWIYGIKWYVKHKWNIYDLIMILFFDAALAFWVWSYVDVKTHNSRHLPRNQWDAYDPTIIAELCYSVAITQAFGKLFYFFQIGQSLGPLLTSLSRMFLDIVHFMSLFIVTMFSFAIGMFEIYHHYTGNIKVVNGEEEHQVESFRSIPSAILTLYWSIYGYAPPDNTEIVVPDKVVQVKGKNVSVPHHHALSEGVGYTIFLVYYIAGIIILVNLLIAMMSTSYSNVEGNRDVEWKFSRTKVWMIFFQPGQTLPPPFNMIPSPKTFYDTLRWFCMKCKGSRRAGWSFYQCCFFRDNIGTDYEDERNYELLMAKLVQRYLTSKRVDSNGHSNDSEREDLMLQVKELREMTHELRRIVTQQHRALTLSQNDDSVFEQDPQDSALVDDVFLPNTR